MNVKQHRGKGDGGLIDDRLSLNTRGNRIQDVRLNNIQGNREGDHRATDHRGQFKTQGNRKLNG